MIATSLFVVVGLLLLGLAVERINTMERGTRLRWLKAPLWCLVGMLGLGLLLTPAKADPGSLRYKASDGGVIDLTAERGPCSGEARVAIYTSPDAKTKVQGCYRLRSGSVVQVAWFDGDYDMVPASRFRPVETM